MVFVTIRKPAHAVDDTWTLTMKQTSHTQTLLDQTMQHHEHRHQIIHNHTFLMETRQILTFDSPIPPNQIKLVRKCVHIWITIIRTTLPFFFLLFFNLCFIDKHRRA